jgi:hypothetical protein
MFRVLLAWALENPDAFNAFLTANSITLTQAGGKYISQTNHGGKMTAYTWPQSSSGQGLPLAIVQGMLGQVAWMIGNYTPDEIANYLKIAPSDTQVAVYW